MKPLRELIEERRETFQETNGFIARREDWEPDQWVHVFAFAEKENLVMGDYHNGTCAWIFLDDDANRRYEVISCLD